MSKFGMEGPRRGCDGAYVVAGASYGTPATPPTDSGSGNCLISLPSSAASIADFQIDDGRPLP